MVGSGVPDDTTDKAEGEEGDKGDVIEAQLHLHNYLFSSLISHR